MNRDLPAGALDRLLAAWRAEIDSVPVPELVSTEQALVIITKAAGCPCRSGRGRRHGPARKRMVCRPMGFLRTRRGRTGR
ncbi:hypothetical protein [Amycolatopsis sp. 195334CR]|uniref:hypothetical protein n=1 Tax=Amycolatopsis sp. 195334CR TaxID=2814588 RepID=UPI001A8F4AA1|nr:hypothetical protein [Amycolatopsis sp. 195334CR]MBN6037690.1 hypothetical protein [Amycolatopsis sp. 195334CR]